MKLRRTALFLLALFVLIAVFLVMGGSFPAQAQSGQPTPQGGGNPHLTNDCIGCHNRPMKGVTENGDIVSLSYDPATHKDIKHYMNCAGCHEAQSQYPHRGSTSASCATCHTEITGANNAEMVFKLSYKDARDLTSQMNQSCNKCHGLVNRDIEKSAHTRVLQEGNTSAPLCSDCHGSHTIVSPKTPRNVSAEMCATCHRAEYTTYRTSVHGAALSAESNPDVPTCIDCHGAHNVQGGVYGDDFRASAAEMCGKCHANPEMMRKYRLSTDVLRTYLDDVHGPKTLFGEVEKAVTIQVTCYDCHGVHNIRSAKDPASRVNPENLQKTCQQCHKDATVAFSDTWLGHKTPSMTSLPGIYLTNVLSLGAIVVVVIAVILFILLDLRRHIASSIIIRIRRDK